MEKIVVVGAVAAGPKAACRAKRLMPEAEITLIDQDNLISYGGCGIPYYVSGDVSDDKELMSTSFHMLRDSYFFQEAKGLNVKIRTKALFIDRTNKTLNVRNLDSGEEYGIEYDKLVLATGSRPNVIPVEGRDLDGIFTISSLHKAIAIKDRLAGGKVGKAVIIGGGAIGIEMAEAFKDLWGVETSIVEFMPQVLPRIVDRTIAAMVENHLRENGVEVYTGEGAQRFEGDDQGHVIKVVTSKRELEADIVVMSAGVRPRGELAAEAGLQVSPMGGIVVNNRMQTSDPNIFAAGDCVDTINLITGKRAYAPLGSLANREGRVVADNLANIPTQFEGVVGSFIMKVFDLAVGSTGLSLEVAKSEGYEAVGAMSVQSDRAHFFPTQALMFNHLVVDKYSRRVLGMQGVGKMGDGLLARINASAALLGKKPDITDFSNLEMAYAPPFSTAVDVLNAAANVADNIVSGRMKTIEVEEFNAWMSGEVENKEYVAIDLRHSKEAEIFTNAFPAEKWQAMVYDKVRSDYQKLPSDKTMIMICNAGTRSYEIQLMLRSVGIGNTLVLPGGLNVIRRMGVSWWPEKA